MARIKQVQKFGGVEDLGEVKGNVTDSPLQDIAAHQLKSVEVQSKTKLEQDEGHGNAAIIRMFEFGINPQAFQEHPPTKQELFNSHYKGIEVMLWRDGLKVIPEVNPRIVLNEKKGTYQIFVGAAPMRGHILRERPNTLSELVKAESYGTE